MHTSIGIYVHVTWHTWRAGEWRQAWRAGMNPGAGRCPWGRQARWGLAPGVTGRHEPRGMAPGFARGAGAR